MMGDKAEGRVVRIVGGHSRMMRGRECVCWTAWVSWRWRDLGREPGSRRSKWSTRGWRRAWASRYLEKRRAGLVDHWVKREQWYLWHWRSLFWVRRIDRVMEATNEGRAVEEGSR